MIRKAEIDDIGKITELYYLYIGESFLAGFGKSFLKEFLTGVILCEDGVVFVYESGNNIAGFIIGTVNTTNLIRSLIFNRGMRLFGRISGMVLMNPLLFKDIFDTFTYSGLTKIKDCTAELLFIAVQPEYRKKGFGKELIDKALFAIKSKGTGKVKVTTLNSNKVVNEMLNAYGVCLEKVFKLYGKDMNLYTFK